MNVEQQNLIAIRDKISEAIGLAKIDDPKICHKVASWLCFINAAISGDPEGMVIIDDFFRDFAPKQGARLQRLHKERNN